MVSCITTYLYKGVERVRPGRHDSFKKSYFEISLRFFRRHPKGQALVQALVYLPNDPMPANLGRSLRGTDDGVDEIEYWSVSALPVIRLWLDWYRLYERSGCCRLFGLNTSSPNERQLIEILFQVLLSDAIVVVDLD
jgi:hypothetical protein